MQKSYVGVLGGSEDSTFLVSDLAWLRCLHYGGSVRCGKRCMCSITFDDG